MAQIKIDNVIYGSNNASDIIYKNTTVEEKLDTIPIFDINDNGNVIIENDMLTYGHIVDNLNSIDTNKVLSAKQGKILNEKIDNIDLSYLEDGIEANAENINFLDEKVNTNINNINILNNQVNQNVTDINNNMIQIKNLTDIVSNLNDDIYHKINYGFAEAFFKSTNLNDYLLPGMFRLNNNHTNMPSGSSGWGQLLVVTGGGDTIAQLYFPFNGTTFYLRAGNVVGNDSGSWTSWRTI